MTELRIKVHDDREQIQMKCPACGVWGDVDQDQVDGLVSYICPNCKAHWTVEDDISAEVKIDE